MIETIENNFSKNIFLLIEREKSSVSNTLFSILSLTLAFLFA